MSFDDMFRFGEFPPYNDLRRALLYNKRICKCAECGTETRWILMSTMVPICSEDCFDKQIVNKSQLIEQQITINSLRKENKLLRNKILWQCDKCPYYNVGPICTKCRAPQPDLFVDE